MLKLKSFDQFALKDRGIIHFVKSPVKVERDKESMMAVFGEVEINGNTYFAKDFERFCLNTPLRVGESFGILV